MNLSYPSFCKFDNVGNVSGTQCKHLSKIDGYCKQHYDKLKLEYLEKQTRILQIPNNQTFIQYQIININIPVDSDVEMQIMG